MTNLTKLSLQFNEIEIFPPELSNLRNLKRLNLHHNYLSELPLVICKLYNLESLNLYVNRLSYLPREIGNLVNLIKLRLSDNELETLPEEIYNLTKLQKLDLDLGIDLSRFPDIGKYPKKKKTEIQLFMEKKWAEDEERYKILRENRKNKIYKPKQVILPPRIIRIYEKQETPVVVHSKDQYINGFLRVNNPKEYKKDPNTIKDDNLYHLAYRNDLKELKQETQGRNVSLIDAMKCAINMGHLEICKYIYKIKQYPFLDSFFEQAYENTQHEVMNWILSLGHFPKVEVLLHAIKNLEFEDVKLFMKHNFTLDYHNKAGYVKNNPENAELLVKDYNKQYNYGVVAYMSRNANVKKLRWLLDNGFKLKEATNINEWVDDDDTSELMFLYHERKIPGYYQQLCYDGKCSYCEILAELKVEELNDLWELETEKYDSYIQMLPNEILEDLCDLIMTF